MGQELVATAGFITKTEQVNATPEAKGQAAPISTNLSDHVCSGFASRACCNCSGLLQRKEDTNAKQVVGIASSMLSHVQTLSGMARSLPTWRFSNGWRMPLVRHSSNNRTSCSCARPCSWSYVQDAKPCMVEGEIAYGKCIRCLKPPCPCCLPLLSSLCDLYQGSQ